MMTVSCKLERGCYYDSKCYSVGALKICPNAYMTNADRIRAMSDEKLAEEISRNSILDLCDIVCGGDCKAVATFNKTSEQRCAEIVLDWLQQPAEEVENGNKQ